MTDKPFSDVPIDAIIPELSNPSDLTLLAQILEDRIRQLEDKFGVNEVSVMTFSMAEVAKALRQIDEKKMPLFR